MIHGLDALRGAVVWITGVPASGKTTLAEAVRAALRSADIATLWLDSDDVRRVLSWGADAYTEAGRDSFYAAVGHLARLGADGGVTVLVSATASRRRYRDDTRARVARFVEVFLDCGPDAVRKRDVKGLYAAADAGVVTALPGVGVDYEPPARPEIRVDTSDLSAEAVAAEVLATLRSLEVT